MGLGFRARKLVLSRDRAGAAPHAVGLALLASAELPAGLERADCTAAAGFIADVYVIARHWPESWDEVRAVYRRRVDDDGDFGRLLSADGGELLGRVRLGRAGGLVIDYDAAGAGEASRMRVTSY